MGLEECGVVAAAAKSVAVRLTSPNAVYQEPGHVDADFTRR